MYERMYVCIYTQGDKNVSVHLSVLPHYLAQSDCLKSYRQGQGDSRLTLIPSVIPNSNYFISLVIETI
jgi:hypothetical protein